MKRYLIRDPIFGASVELLICSVEAYNRYITKRYPAIPLKDLAVAGDDALFEDKKATDGTKDRFIWLPDWKDDNDHMTRLTHEVDHAREAILRFIGLRRTKASEEAYTYYTAWLLGECLKRLRRTK